MAVVVLAERVGSFRNRPTVWSRNREGRPDGLHCVSEDAMLHKTSELRGYHIVATDGEIGHVDDFLIDEGGQTVRYLVVDTSNWIGGRSVLISVTAVEQIDSPAKK